MRLAFALLLLLHGAIHLLGFAKGFGLAEVAQLQRPVTRPAAVLWLVAALLFAAAAALVLLAPALWWLPALPALLLSQGLVLGAWADARFGTVANLLVLLPLAVSLLDLAPWSLSSRYRHEVAARPPASAAGAPLVAEGDLIPLPAPVQRWLRRAGVVGRPHPRGFQARFRGRIRSGPEAPWMEFTAEQRSTLDPPDRLFLLHASRGGIPFDALHLLVGPSATMEVRAAALVEVIRARGPEMDRAETVTFLNDLCALAPGALLRAPVRWEAVDERSARVAFTRGAQTVGALLTFDEAGDLTGFVSSDRYRTVDGRTFERLPWSTPLSGHRDFGGLRLPERGLADWRAPAGSFTYGEFTLLEASVDP